MLYKTTTLTKFFLLFFIILVILFPLWKEYNTKYQDLINKISLNLFSYSYDLNIKKIEKNIDEQIIFFESEPTNIKEVNYPVVYRFPLKISNNSTWFVFNLSAIISILISYLIISKSKRKYYFVIESLIIVVFIHLLTQYLKYLGISASIEYRDYFQNYLIADQILLAYIYDFFSSYISRFEPFLIGIYISVKDKTVFIL